MTREDYSKYYIQGSDHCLIPKYVFKELFNEMINWKKESQKKKEAIDKAIDYLNNNICYVGEKITIKPYTDLKELLDILKEVSE